MTLSIQFLCLKSSWPPLFRPVQLNCAPSWLIWWSHHRNRIPWFMILCQLIHEGQKCMRLIRYNVVVHNLFRTICNLHISSEMAWKRPVRSATTPAIQMTKKKTGVNDKMSSKEEKQRQRKTSQTKNKILKPMNIECKSLNVTQQFSVFSTISLVDSKWKQKIVFIFEVELPIL